MVRACGNLSKHEFMTLPFDYVAEYLVDEIERTGRMNHLLPDCDRDCKFTPAKASIKDGGKYISEKSPRPCMLDTASDASTSCDSDTEPRSPVTSSPASSHKASVSLTPSSHHEEDEGDYITV